MSNLIKYDSNFPSEKSLFPQSVEEIDEWAKKFGFLNSYNTLGNASSTHMGKYQKGIIESLQNANPFTEEQILFIKKVEAAVDIINTLEIHKDLKKVIINEVVVNDAPWLLEGPIDHIPKQIAIQEIIKDEFIYILNKDDIVLTGHNPYCKKNNPKEVYEHCLTLQKFDEIDKKIIALALDRKPYYRNQALRGNEVKSLDKILIDREQGTIGFKGNGFDEGFNRFHFLLSICDWDEYGENCYKKTIEEKKEYVRNSERFKNFVPDFESGK